ncbi:MAG: hypothetical protein JO156_07060 [Solirubrobacterales bacterium]|nr:hypothetical protein [Solirubrobacterales bacterium]
MFRLKDRSGREYGQWFYKAGGKRVPTGLHGDETRLEAEKMARDMARPRHETRDETHGVTGTSGGEPAQPPAGRLLEFPPAAPTNSAARAAFAAWTGGGTAAAAAAPPPAVDEVTRAKVGLVKTKAATALLKLGTAATMLAASLTAQAFGRKPNERSEDACEDAEEIIDTGLELGAEQILSVWQPEWWHLVGVGYVWSVVAMVRTGDPVVAAPTAPTSGDPAKAAA